jgi:hypothetical protein
VLCAWVRHAWDTRHTKASMLMLLPAAAAAGASSETKPVQVDAKDIHMSCGEHTNTPAQPGVQCDTRHLFTSSRQPLHHRFVAVCSRDSFQLIVHHTRSSLKPNMMYNILLLLHGSGIPEHPCGSQCGSWGCIQGHRPRSKPMHHSVPPTLQALVSTKRCNISSPQKAQLGASKPHTTTAATAASRHCCRGCFCCCS